MKSNNKLGEWPIPKLVLSMSLPAILSMLVQALYNIVDSVFVARISENALTAISLAFPIQMIVIAIVVGLGIGNNSVISRRLGEKKPEEAANAAEHGYLIATGIYAILILLALTLPAHFFPLFTTDQEVIDFAIQYIQIILLLSFGRIYAQVGLSIMQASGNMIGPMVAQLVGAITNIVLDPIFIFGLGFIPALGVRGAAIATIIGQVFSMILTLILIQRSQGGVKPRLKNFHWNFKILKDILAVGLPAMIMQGLNSIMLTGMNFIIAGFSVTAVAVFGAYMKIQSFIFMPVFGLSQGIMSVLGYNYGAKNRERITHALRFACFMAASIMGIGLIFFQFFPDFLLHLFNASDQMLEIGVIAFRRISLCFIFAGVAIMFTTLFQAIGAAYLSMIFSFIRQIIFLLPFAYLFGRLGGLDSVWFSFIASEFLSFFLILFFANRVFKKRLNF